MGVQNGGTHENIKGTRSQLMQSACCSDVINVTLIPRTKYDYRDLENKMDSIGLLNLIQKLTYTRGTNKPAHKT